LSDEARHPWVIGHRGQIEGNLGCWRTIVNRVKAVGLVFANIELSSIVCRAVVAIVLFRQPHVAIAKDLVQGSSLDIPLLHKCSCLVDVTVIGCHGLRVACVKVSAIGLQFHFPSAEC